VEASSQSYSQNHSIPKLKFFRGAILQISSTKINPRFTNPILSSLEGETRLLISNLIFYFYVQK